MRQRDDLDVQVRAVRDFSQQVKDNIELIELGELPLRARSAAVLVVPPLRVRCFQPGHVIPSAASQTRASKGRALKPIASAMPRNKAFCSKQ